MTASQKSEKTVSEPVYKDSLTQDKTTVNTNSMQSTAENTNNRKSIKSRVNQGKSQSGDGSVIEP